MVYSLKKLLYKVGYLCATCAVKREAFRRKIVVVKNMLTNEAPNEYRNQRRKALVFVLDQ